MERDEVLLLCGEVIGLLHRCTPEEIEEAAGSAELYPEYRVMLLRIAAFRRLLFSPPDPDTDKSQN